VDALTHSKADLERRVRDQPDQVSPGPGDEAQLAAALSRQEAMCSELSAQLTAQAAQSSALQAELEELRALHLEAVKVGAEPFEGTYQGGG
jgi:hypothetical protein